MLVLESGLESKAGEASYVGTFWAETKDSLKKGDWVLDGDESGSFTESLKSSFCTLCRVDEMSVVKYGFGSIFPVPSSRERECFPLSVAFFCSGDEGSGRRDWFGILP